MATFIKGDIVVVPFPFSDLTQTKRRPTLVVANLTGDDLILCQITSKAIRDGYFIPLENSEFEIGSLNQSSNIRPNRLFTADRGIILYKIGALSMDKLNATIDKIVEILQAK